MILNRSEGLWTKKYEIGTFFGQQAGDVFVIFGGPTNEQYQKIQEAESSMLPQRDGEGIEFEYKDPQSGQITKRRLDPQGIARQIKAIGDVMSRRIIDHNFFKKDEKNPGNETGIKLTDKEVWDWINDRAELTQYLINDWRSSIPFERKAKE